MKIEELKDVVSLANAYIVVGSSERGPDEVLAFLESRNVTTRGNLDILTERFQEMKVDDVRDTLTPFASLKPLGDFKYCIVSFSTANANAQNALLKVVEESPGKTRFFFCVDLLGNVLPTLRSRCIVVTTERASEGANEGRAESEDFLSESFPSRLSIVEKMTSYISKTQDRKPARDFLNGLLMVAHAKEMPHRTLRDILDANGYMRLSGSSPKSILSHLAVTLPKL